MSVAIQEHCFVSEQRIFAHMAKGCGGREGGERAAAPEG